MGSACKNCLLAWTWVVLVWLAAAESNRTDDLFVGVRVGEEDGLMEQVEVEALGGVFLREAAKTVASHLRRLGNQEMGFTAMQTVYDSLPFAPMPTNNDRKAQELASRLEQRLKKYVAVLNRSRTAVEDLFSIHLNKPLATTLPCYQVPSSTLVFSSHFGTKVSLDHTCDVIPPLMDLFAFRPGQNLTKTFAENLRSHPAIKWQYFISSEGAHSEYPAHPWSEESRHRDVYLSTVRPQSKHIVIVVDRGNSLSPHQVAVCKGIAKHVLGSLGPRDKVGVLGLANDVIYAPGRGSGECLSHKLAPATQETRAHFKLFVDGMSKSTEGTNHARGIQAAFELIRNTEGEGEEALVVYVSRGLLSSLTEAKVVMQAVADEANKTMTSVVINTYVAIDDAKPVMYEKHFLQDLAHQSYTKYNVTPPAVVRPGLAMAVNSTQDLEFTVGQFYSVLQHPGPAQEQKKGPTFSLPRWDAVGKGAVVSISQPCFHVDHLLGVVGIDLHLADIAQDFTYFNRYADARAFLLDASGVAVMHPSFSRPSFVPQPPTHTDIAYLEHGIGTIRTAMLSDSSGNHTMGNMTYSWRHAPPYVAVIASSTAQLHGMKRVGLTPPSGMLLYHRLDLQAGATKARFCRHFRQTASTDAASLFLSPSAFMSPFDALTHEEMTLANVQSYMAYIGDNTKLIANPGLKAGVRSEVRALSRVVADWRRQFLQSGLAKYIVRRFVATPSGTFVSFPASRVEHHYDATRRPWYLRALEHPGKVVLTPPYLDSGGAGYIVTASHAVYEGRSVSLHSSRDAVVAVVAVDLTLGYMYKAVRDAMPSCGRDKLKCFLLDEMGYLVTHPSLNEAVLSGVRNGAPTPVEQQHVTHREPLVANDILNHRGFVQKSLCNSFPDRTVQRYYRFNISFTKEGGGVITNLVHGEQCSRYQVTPVPGSNVFLAAVNETCDTVTTFCPCSMVDRLCLNCHRMEQSECECPCECPLQLDLCDGGLLDSEGANPTCSYFPEQPPHVALPDAMGVAEHQGDLQFLPPCFPINCAALESESECFGVMGCEWCTLDLGGDTPLTSPFCTDQSKCFGGVLGAPSPYHPSPPDPLPSEEYLSFKSTPVGPVAGGTMVFFLVLALMVYCYRHHVHQRGVGSSCDSSRGYLATLPGGGGNASGVRMSQLDNEGDGDSHYEDLSPAMAAGHHNVGGDEEEDDQAPLAVSPYRVSTGYRRPAGGDSDHGYSTMTPHEDSEHLPYFEPLLMASPRGSSSRSETEESPARDWGRRNVSRGGAEGASGEDQTVLPDQHHVLAPVTVHMMDVS